MTITEDAGQADGILSLEFVPYWEFSQFDHPPFPKIGVCLDGTNFVAATFISHKLGRSTGISVDRVIEILKTCFGAGEVTVEREHSLRADEIMLRKELLLVTPPQIQVPPAARP